MKKFIAIVVILLAVLVYASHRSSVASETAIGVQAAATAVLAEHALTTPAAVDVAARNKAVLPPASFDPQTDVAIDNMLGNHVAYHRAIDDLQKAVATNDKDAVAAMVRYPMTVQVDGEKVVIENASRFKQYYGKLLPPDTAHAISDAHYTDVRMNNEGVMLGSAWMNGVCKDAACTDVDIKIATIQPNT